MKKYILFLIAIFTLTFFSNLEIIAQTITYEELQEVNKRPKGKFVSYVANGGETYTVGQKIRFNAPSDGRNFIFIQIWDKLVMTVMPLSSRASGKEYEIRVIRIGGNKRVGYSASISCKGLIGTQDYLIDFENAVSAGEVQPTGMTSDQALAELKKAKDKLDLDLITNEEYNKIKAELIKYIK